MPNVLVSLYDQFLKCSGGLQIFVWDKFMAGILVNVKATNDQKATVVENCLEMEEVDGCKEVSAVELAVANELYVTVMTSSMHVTSSSCWLFCVRYP